MMVITIMPGTKNTCEADDCSEACSLCETSESTKIGEPSKTCEPSKNSDGKVHI